MVSKRTLKSYMQPVHDTDCGFPRDEEGQIYSAALPNGPVRCTCGLDEARQRIEKHEVDIQCQQHYGGASVCRLVQLRHRVGISNEWQEPRWVCEGCRSHMPGQFRYCDEEQFNLHLALADGVVM